MPFRILAAFLSLWLAVTPAWAGLMLLLGAGLGSASTFTPAQLPGVLVWLTADQGVTGSSPVTQWTDQISGIQFTSGNGPAFNATGFNGKQGIVFTGATNMQLSSGASAVSFGAANNTAAFAAVVNWGASGNASGFLPYLATGDATEVAGANSVSIRFLTGPAMQVVQSSAGFTNDSFTGGANLRMLWNFDGTNETSFFNNVQQTQAALNFNFGAVGTGNGELTIGNNASGLFPATVVIAEIVITKSALSPANRLLLDNYFRTHWGL